MTGSKESIEMFNLLVSNMIVGTVTTDLQGRIVHVNPAAEKMYGYSKEELLGKNPGMFNAEERAEQIASEIFQTVMKGQVWEGQLLQRRRDGSTFTIYTYVHPVRDEGGVIRYFSSSNIDISAKKQMEDRLRSSQQELELLLKNSPDTILRVDRSGTILYINKTLPPFQAERIVGSSAFLFLFDRHAQRFRDGLSRAFTTGNLQEMEIASLQDSVWWARIIPEWKEGRCDTCLVIASNITNQKRLERELARQLDERSNHLERLMEMAEDAIVVVDESQRIVNVNVGFERTFKYSRQEIIGRMLDVLIPEQYRKKHSEQFREFIESVVSSRRMGRRGRIQGLRKNGELFYAQASISKVTAGGRTLCSAIVRDVSEEILIQEHMMRQQRIESVGTMASGLAHDIKNILQGNVSLLKMGGGALAPAQRQFVERAFLCCERMGELTMKLQAIARPEQAQRCSVDVSAAVDEVFAIVGASTSKLIRKDNLIAPNSCHAHCNRNDLLQVFLNLSLNAVHAIEEKGATASDRIAVSVRSHGRAGQLGAGFVCIEFADTGCGIPPGIVGKIFEPFFTTKQKGKVRGEGLGLSMVHDIVKKKYGGDIEVDSAVGHGATFRIYLPEAGRVELPAAAQADAAATGGGGTVLVVDDDQEVVNFIRATLNLGGYEVLQASDGVKGLELFNSNAEAIHTAIVDLDMPAMRGEVLAQKMAERNPKLKILIATGLDEPANLAAVEQVKGVLAKPFLPAQLLRMVRGTFDEAG